MRTKNSKKIPLLITMDLEIASDHNMDQQSEILSKLYEVIEIPMTIFTAANAAEKFSDKLVMRKRDLFEIGCHGLTHSPEENYRILPKDKSLRLIEEATQQIETVLQTRPISFRGPFMGTSADTQNALLENSYRMDFSVSSQRIDFLNTKGGELGWLFAPRTPYNPDRNSPFKRGDSNLLAVPLSCIGLPFISGVLYLFGLSFMKIFFKLLLLEAQRTIQPIVYLFHSYELCDLNIQKVNESSRKQKLIQTFYNQNRSYRYYANLELIKYMYSFEEIIPMNATQFLEYFYQSKEAQKLNV